MGQEILLVGPPNVGKSVLFNRLTGLDVSMANYPGTTVEFKKGEAKAAGKRFTLIDVPGTYDLNASNEAERVAVDMLSGSPAGAVFVLDAKNLESSVHLLLQVLDKGIPTVAAVNRSDLVKGGVDVERLSAETGIAAIRTVAVEGEGIPQLEDLIVGLLDGRVSPARPLFRGWNEAERIAGRVRATPGEGGRRERWGDLMVRPLPGIPLAFLILILIFAFVVGLGMGLRQYVLMPFFEAFVFPPLTAAVEATVPEGTLREILVGEYGFLIKSIEWPLGLVLPYIISFYLALSILEDSGYLPRLAVLVDGVFRRMGLSGSNIIPFLLGYGCAVPAIMSTRNMNDKRKRVTVAAVVCLSVPCVAQSGAFIALLAEHSLLLVALLFAFSLLAAFVSGAVISRLLGVRRDMMVQEIPDLLLPDMRMLGKKLLLRVRHFLKDGVIPMVVIIGAASVLYETGVLLLVSDLMEPLVTGWLGLPKEASTPLIMGVFRRELAVLPLLDMGLGTLQLMTASVIALLYIPCIAVIGVLAKEFGLKVSAAMLLATLAASFLVGGVIAQAGMLLF